MSIAESLKVNKTIVRRGPRCRVCVLMESLPATDKAALQAAFDDLAFMSSQISRALKAEGHDIAAFTVARHRKRECSG